MSVQVASACQRVADLRATVPNQLAQQLTEHLQQCRPVSGAPELPINPPAEIANTSHIDRTDLVDAGRPMAADMALSDHGAGSTSLEILPEVEAKALSVTPLSPAPTELQTMYTAAVQRMPALRWMLLLRSSTPLLSKHL